jgi:hypothetical protein
MSALQTIDATIETVEVVNPPMKPVSTFTAERLRETGEIRPNKYLFFDFTRSSYIKFNSKTGVVTPVSPLATKQYIKMAFPIMEDVKDKVLLGLKKVNTVFDIKKPIRFTEDGEFYLNEFNEKKTKLAEIDQMRRKMKKLDYTAEDFKNEIPLTYALFLNLFEDDSEAVDYFINYLSVFVNEREKIPSSFLLSGIEGAGKGVLLEVVLAYIFGEYCESVNASNLESSFNGYVINKLVVCFNEIKSDFSKSTGSIEKVKEFITDAYFTANIKSEKTYRCENNFITFLYNNHPLAVKISPNDRRFNYFKQEKSLATMAKEKFNLEIAEYIALLKDEQSKFIEILARYKFDRKRTTSLFETKSKAMAKVATTGNVELVFGYIKKMNIIGLTQEIEAVVDGYESLEISSGFSDSFVIYIRKHSAMLKNLEDEFEHRFISAKSLDFLFVLLVTEKSNDISYRNKVIYSNLGESITQRVKGEKMRGRRIGATLSEEESVQLEGDFLMNQPLEF